MNDQLILDMLDSGNLRVDLQTGKVFYRHQIYKINPKATSWREKISNTRQDNNRERFHFQVGKKKFTIHKSRLLFLAKHHKIVDVVDHIDEDKFNDLIDNLQEHSHNESRRQGRELQRQKIIQNAIAFFEYIAFWGEEPPNHLNVPKVTLLEN